MLVNCPYDIIYKYRVTSAEVDDTNLLIVVQNESGQTAPIEAKLLVIASSSSVIAVTYIEREKQTN
jgi:uncharacterized phosphosugar-binding protein